ncbi:MAG TPA: MaoC/PaaZ C-terminal domain-containing protein [Chloroflexaceae bacterium]|nr:MaoC/PaaZ C-terminal domain-containing protein [Chloroflexaceae bacterium]
MSHIEPPAVGAELPGFAHGPLAPELFARYADASGDHNPLHTDPAFARAAGLDGVIAHGMLVMGLLGRLADGLAGPGALREFRVRFRAPTLPGETLRCGGRVTAAYERDGATVVEAELWASGEGGQLKATGTAVAALPGGGR